MSKGLLKVSVRDIAGIVTGAGWDLENDLRTSPIMDFRTHSRLPENPW
jgi:hypothetical protein